MYQQMKRSSRGSTKQNPARIPRRRSRHRPPFDRAATVPSSRRYLVMPWLIRKQSISVDDKFARRHMMCTSSCHHIKHQSNKAAAAAEDNTARDNQLTTVVCSSRPCTTSSEAVPSSSSCRRSMKAIVLLFVWRRAGGCVRAD